MRWIDPSQVKRNIVKCEFCGTDVSTPYKGVHDETEIVNGLPVKCRNNGRLNCDIAWPHLTTYGTQPKENFKWFVEHPETRLWWSGYKWTSDPNEAFGCDKKSTADRYAKFHQIKDYIITEHEFVAS